jgi:hypothetical protein
LSGAKTSYFITRQVCFGKKNLYTRIFTRTHTFSSLASPFRFTLIWTGAEDKATQGCDLSADSGAKPCRG